MKKLRLALARLLIMPELLEMRREIAKPPHPGPYENALSECVRKFYNQTLKDDELERAKVELALIARENRGKKI